MKTLDLRHHDTLTVKQVKEIISEHAMNKLRVKSIIVLPTVVKQWNDDRIDELEDKLEMLKAGEIAPEQIEPYEPSLEAAIESLEGYIESMKSPPDNSLVQMSDFFISPFGRHDIISKERDDV